MIELLFFILIVGFLVWVHREQNKVDGVGWTITTEEHDRFMDKNFFGFSKRDGDGNPRFGLKI